MLWSLIKIIAFIAVVLALTFGATRLMEVEGGALITVAGTEFQLTPLQIVFGFIALVVAVWIGLKLLKFLWACFKFLNGDETAISRYFDRNRERRGYEALSEGMVALASGEGHLALTKAQRADRYLKQPRLTMLLKAQAAEMTGDRSTAEAAYKELLTDPETKFVGVRGIMKQRLAAGETDKALALAEKAFALKPKHEETQDVLLKLQAQKEDWAGARKTLGAKLRAGNMPRDVHKRRDAVLALSEAKDVMDDGKAIEAREAAIEANRLSPDLVPAAVMAAESYIAEAKPRYATRVLTKAWTQQPHPDLAAAFAAIAPDEKPAERIKRFKALTKGQPDHPETRMLMTELHIAAEDFDAADAALGKLTDEDPSARSLALKAAIERGTGAGDAVVRGWLTKALTAPRGPQWVCDNCGEVSASWSPVCSSCEAFDTLSWKEPKGGQIVMSGGSDMLPLLVGPADPPATPTVEDVELIEAEEASAKDTETVAAEK